jgi:hypothetical protein
VAFADIVNLIVQLKLDDKISAPLKTIDSRLSKMNVNTGQVAQGFNKVGKGLATGLIRGTALAASGVGLLSTQVIAGVHSLQQLEEVQGQTAAVLKSTGGQAGITAKQVRAMAQEYENLGGVIDDKVIQSAENVLLTFTKVNKEAFKPALESALDLSTALDQDLQSSVIQIGKALNDPIKGITALRRVGVSFTADQETLIKKLVDENKLFDAQQVILKELGKEFGGSFAAKGKTGEAAIARFGDAIEGLQQNLAIGFLPVIDKVSRRLSELFSDPAVIAKVRAFGQNIADFFTDERLNAAGDAVRNLFGYLSQVPWSAIGSGLKIAGQAAKVAVDAFNSLPPQVQGVVIAALAANKLTGGLVASGIGDIAKGLLGGTVKGLFSGMRGGTPATPLFTKEVGLPGGGGPGGPGGGPLGLLKNAALLAPAVLAAAVIAGGEGAFGGNVAAAKAAARQGAGGRGFLPGTAGFRTAVPVKIVGSSTPGGQFNAANAGGTPVNVLRGAPLTAIGAGIRVLRDQVRASLRDNDIHAARVAQRQIDTLNALRGTVDKRVSDIIPALGNVNRALSVANRTLQDGNARQREMAQGIREARDRIGTGFARSNDQLGVIARKPTSFTANVTNTVTAYLSTYQSLQTMTRINTLRAGVLHGGSTGGST